MHDNKAPELYFHLLDSRVQRRLLTISAHTHDVLPTHRATPVPESHHAIVGTPYGPVLPTPLTHTHTHASPNTVHNVHNPGTPRSISKRKCQDVTRMDLPAAAILFAFAFPFGTFPVFVAGEG